MKQINDFIHKFLLELSLLAVGAFVTFVITTKVQAATQEQRIDNLEQSIEILRKENREDHKNIMDMLRKP